ncbi:YutD family protein [Bacillus massiliigorillae]|uniref:YutD family protein n=1 Tax=Bacillus massiliigorillae TaxID=1243664 RepID=UPI00039DF033|nr:YutD family protein [Bacillus massiliigorillae]
MVTINNLQYEVVEDFRNGFNEEAFKARYSDILNKYDFVVGDWGYGQLRLRGFFEDQNQKASFDTKISTLSEYLYEFCNFGCPYFVVKRLKSDKK